MRGPDSRVSRPMKNVPVPSTRAAARPSATIREVVRSASASPRTPSVPKRSTPTLALPLGVLRRLAGLLEAVLATLLLARVACEQAGLLQHRPGVGIERDERAGDSEPDRTRLAAHAATVEGRVDVVDLFGLREPQRLLGDDLVREDREVRLERAAVHEDLPAAVPDPHAGDRFLATTGRLDQRLGQVKSFF